MNVNLAFSPNTHYVRETNFGALGTQFPGAIELTVPQNLFKRIIYLRFATDPDNLNFLVTGRITFRISGQVIGEIPLKLSGSNSPNGTIQFGTGFTEDGLIIFSGVTPIQLNMVPNEFICACTKITWETQSQTTIPGTHQPVWAFACKSLSHW